MARLRRVLKLVGLTGGIGTGKSTVARMIRDMGVPVIDADVLARQVVEPDKPAWKDIVDYFGTQVLQEDRARALCAIIPEIAVKVAEITEKPVPDTGPIEGRIMHRLVAKKWTSGGTVRIAVRNYTDKPVSPAVYDTSPDPAPDADPKPGYAHTVGEDHTRVWKLTLGPGEGWEAKYTGKGGGTLDIQGVEEAVKMVVDLDV